MNIFRIEYDPDQCAISMGDKHVVKMILETAQLLSTAHRFLDGKMEIVVENGRRKKRWTLPDDRETLLYKATHINHPCASWCRQSDSNYIWLHKHLKALCKEYTYRYGKIHKAEREKLVDMLAFPPNNISKSDMTRMPCAMPVEYVISGSEGASKDADVIKSYRNYYLHAKQHLHNWKNRETPSWI